MSDRLVAGPLPDNTQHSQQGTSMPSVGSEPTISAGDRPQSYALDRAATLTGQPVYSYLWMSILTNYKNRILFQPLTTCLMHCDSTFDDAGNATRPYSLYYCVTVDIDKESCTWKLSQRDLRCSPGQGCTNSGRQDAQGYWMLLDGA